MKVQEVRECLKKFSENEAKELVVALYKAMPKALKEEKEIDALITEFQDAKDPSKKKTAKAVDIYALEEEIETFIQNAYLQNYMVPNRVISKSERPKWRFHVKRYYKTLYATPANSPEGKIATKLLWKLYDMLCYGCNYYIFNTQDPFNSAGFRQFEYFDALLKRMFSADQSIETFQKAVDSAATWQLDYNTVNADLIGILLEYLSSEDELHIVMNIAKQKADEIENALKASGRRSSASTEYYAKREKVQNLAAIVLCVCLRLEERKSGISYFKEHVDEKNKEIMLYMILEYIAEYGTEEDWILTYEEAVRKGIQPRETLQERYKKIKKEMES